jgi:hypothetical protein
MEQKITKSRSPSPKKREEKKEEMKEEYSKRFDELFALIAEVKTK